jgi:hypothetical protein
LAVRAHVEEHFTDTRMVEDYLRLYQRVLGETADEAVRERRLRPAGARCDACHERKPHVRRSRDGLLTVCAQCARGADISICLVEAAITDVVDRAPRGERRTLRRRLEARQAMHSARRERKRLHVGAG